MSACYIDTSALAKWYVNEPGSEAFEDFVRGIDWAIVSRLTALELRCLLARRRRAGDFDRNYERRAFATFRQDLGLGHLRLLPYEDAQVINAVDLVDRLDPVPLRALDAMHLALALHARCERLATSDQIMAQAAEALGLTVDFIGAPA